MAAAARDAVRNGAIRSALASGRPPLPPRLAQRFAHGDPRLGGRLPLHTAGLQQGMALAAAKPPRSFLYATPNRDVAAERAQVAHAATFFHATDVRSFTTTELSVWRAGLWRNEWHYGRRGWWWEVDGGWYPYANPLWPYPLVVAAPVVYATPVVDGPDLSAEEGVAPPPLADAPAAPDGTPASAASQSADSAAPAAPTAPDATTAPPSAATAQQANAALPDIPPLPPAPVGWYRCEAPSGYFPGVADCTANWTLVENAPLPGEQ